MTELIWDGKYDAAGRRVAPLRVSLPFQTVETINESAVERQQALDLFSTGRDPQWRNRLIWGDKKYVLSSLLEEFQGAVDLIYIDPPFNVGADFSYMAGIPGSQDDEESVETTFIKEPSMIEIKAYRDTWGRGLDTYLSWFSDTVAILSELLDSHGTIYVHLDWHVGNYAKVILDEVFGYANFISQIIWQRVTSHSDKKGFGFNHDMILVYSKSKDFTWNPQYIPHSDNYIGSHYTQIDKSGRKFRWDNATAAGQGPSRTFFGKELEPPKGTHWRWSQENIDKLIEEGRIELTSKGMPQYKRYLDEMKGKVVQSVWTDISPVNSQALEDTGYSTQKPEELLERVISASSNENNLVLDCFCGSGTTPVVAEKLNRRWIACDLGRFAIHTTRKRLLGIQGVKPFVVQNLGKYERQAWQSSEFDPAAAQAAYRDFVLKLYHAQPVHGYTWLHGLRAGHMVHVGAVDAPVSAGDVANLVSELKRSIGSGADAPQSNHVDILAWDFAFELNEVAQQQAALANVQLHFYRIPRDVMDKRAVEQGDIHFFELAALSVATEIKGRKINLSLTDFVIPPDDVPQDVQKAVQHWSQWIDYWAVDWDNHSDTFHNMWQTYRTKKAPKLATKTDHVYEQPGEYSVVVKVIDILGNDTTRTVKITVE